MVKDGDVDAAFVNQPRTEQARRLGLKVIDIPTQDMIFFMTVSSSAKMVTERPDVVKRVLKSVLEGIAYFKTHRDETIKILLAKHKKEGDLDLDMATKVYDDLAPRLEPKLYPSLPAVYNVYQEALKQDEKNGDAAKIHPLALWNVNFLREIDDSGFINNLYKDHPQLLNGYGG
jgi:ABC-type nitrate/sulfonate/bicarbonate transport system substrate-binding protein